MEKATVKQGRQAPDILAGLASVLHGRRSFGRLRWPGPLPGWKALALAVALALSIMAVAAVMLNTLRDETLVAAETNIARVNLVLAESIERQVQTVDLLLRDVAMDVGEATSADFATSPAFHDQLERTAVGVPMVQRLWVTDATGHFISGSGLANGVTTSVADRNYFTTLREHPQAGLVVTEPIRSRITGSWTFLIARRIEGPHGQFLGVAGVSVNPNYFESLAAATAPELGARVVLMRGDMVLLQRHPNITDYYGRSVAAFPSNSGLFAGGRLAGSGRYLSVVDQRERVIAGRKLEHYPFAVSLGVPVDTILEPWRRLAFVVSMAAVVVGFGMAALVLGLHQQVQRRRAGEAALAKAHEALSDERGRLWSVVEAAHDGFWEWHIDTGVVDWSERCCLMMGLPAAGGVLHIEQVVAMVVPEDRDSYWRTLRHHVSSEDSFDVEARWLALDGRIRWLASRGRVVRDATGRAIRVVGSNADITERKRFEQRLFESPLGQST